MQKSGFLPIGEANNIVMLFPQVLYYFISINTSSILLQIKHNPLQGNPSGCWDWWGYLGLGGDLVGYTYATKHGKQMAGVAQMIEKVANISMF